MRARPLLSLLVLVAACGGADPEPVASLSVPWRAPLQSCIQAQALALSMVATLSVGGNFAPCTLAVAGDLSASGDCGPYSTGRVRPLMVTYAMKNPSDSTARPRPLAYFVGFANLCAAALQSGQSTATVSLASSTTSAFFYKQTDVVALQTVTADVASCAFALPEAESWAREQILSSSDTLDSDGDCATNPSGPCWNLEEACAGTLF
jgi:hypothetical protein